MPRRPRRRCHPARSPPWGSLGSGVRRSLRHGTSRSPDRGRRRRGRHGTSGPQPFAAAGQAGRVSVGYQDGPSDEPLLRAWNEFCERLMQAGQKVFKDANPADPPARADAFRLLTQNLSQAFPLALETRDPAYPQIHYFTTPTMKLGSDVADFTYRQAWIDGNHEY